MIKYNIVENLIHITGLFFVGVFPMENAAYYFAETVFIGESTAGETRHGLNSIVLAGEGNIMYSMYSIHVYMYIYV